jgi:hypothetical protein
VSLNDQTINRFIPFRRKQRYYPNVGYDSFLPDPSTLLGLDNRGSIPSRGREGKGREGKGREGKGREGKGREGNFCLRHRVQADSGVHPVSYSMGVDRLFPCQ